MAEIRPKKGTGMRSRNGQSPTRQGMAARELREAKRKKRKQQVLRNRIILGVTGLAVIALVIFFIVKLVGGLFDFSEEASSTTITFNEDGQIVYEEVISFDTDTYSKSELKDYITDLASSFNETYGEKAITVDKVKVKDNQAYIKSTYKDAECYASFSSYETYMGAYEDAVEAGYDFSQLFSSVSDNVLSVSELVDAETEFAGMQVAVVHENVTVVVPGQIKYVSSCNAELVDESTVTITQKDGNEDATDLVIIIYTKQ